MRLTTPHGISSPPFRFQGELCLWLLKKCYPCLRYTCYLCLQSIQGDVRGGSCDAFYLVAALPRWASVVNIPARKPGKTEKIDRPTTQFSAVAPSVKRARWH